MEERIQKILSRTGLGSRRACEELIAAGRVTVNGRVAQLGDKADPQTDRIQVDGREISSPASQVYIALYKPRGVISTVDTPDRRQTVVDLVPVGEQVYPVGRLDVDSEGLILLTNDGELTNRLTHPRYGHEKEYRVLVATRPDDEQLANWRRGIVLEDGYRTAPAEVWVEGTHGKGAWIRVTMREGRKRQIREIGQRIGLPVVRLIRIRIGSLLLGSLKPKEWRYLTPQEVAELKGEGPKSGRQPAARRPGRPVGSKPSRRTGQPDRSRQPGEEQRRRPASSPRSSSRDETPARPDRSTGRGSQRGRGQPGEERGRDSRRGPGDRSPSRGRKPGPDR